MQMNFARPALRRPAAPLMTAEQQRERLRALGRPPESQQVRILLQLPDRARVPERARAYAMRPRNPNPTRPASRIRNAEGEPGTLGRLCWAVRSGVATLLRGIAAAARWLALRVGILR